MQHFEDEVHADLLKTAEDVSKEAAPLKQRLLAPALMGLSMLPGAGCSKPPCPPTSQSQPAQQISGPSYDETAKWLVSKINGAGTTESSSVPSEKYEYETDSQENASISDGQFRYTLVTYDSSLKKTVKNNNSLRLDEVSSVEVKNVGIKGEDAWCVAIHAPTTVKGETPGGLAINGIYRVATLWFTDQSTANRVKTGFEHLVKLSQVGRPKEPF